MTYVILAISFIIAGFMLGVGDGGRGSWSKHISTAAGLVWLVSMVYAFVSLGLLKGGIALLVSFVVCGLMMGVGKSYISNMRNN